MKQCKTGKKKTKTKFKRWSNKDKFNLTTFKEYCDIEERNKKYEGFRYVKYEESKTTRHYINLKFNEDEMNVEDENDDTLSDELNSSNSN